MINSVKLLNKFIYFLYLSWQIQIIFLPAPINIIPFEIGSWISMNNSIRICHWKYEPVKHSVVIYRRLLLLLRYIWRQTRLWWQYWPNEMFAYIGWNCLTWVLSSKYYYTLFVNTFASKAYVLTFCFIYLLMLLFFDDFE